MVVAGGGVGADEPDRGNRAADDVSYAASAARLLMFSYAKNRRSRYHRRYTLCGAHFSEGHDGKWQDWTECREGFEREMVAWYGTNEFNFEKRANPPAFEPTLCARYKSRINLGTDGYTINDNGYWCARCAPMLMTGPA